MSPSLMDGFVAFLVISFTMIITTFTAMWVDRAGLGGSNHKIDSWWGRPIKRSDYEPSETSFWRTPHSHSSLQWILSVNHSGRPDVLNS